MKQLLSKHPELTKEWHPTKNGDLIPENFSLGSGKKVWWLCPKGHSYVAIIVNRNRRNTSGCPYCSGRKVGEDNNLKVLFPKIAAEWHPTKNDDLSPDQVTVASNKKVWWFCPKGHSYDTRIFGRTRKSPTSCPYCASRKIGKDNNLKVLSLKYLSPFELAFLQLIHQLFQHLTIF